MKKIYMYGGIGIILIVFFFVPLVKNGGVSITGYQYVKELLAGTYSNST